MPIWQLDGGRGFHALSRHQAWFLIALIATAWFFTHEGLLFLILIVAVFQAAAKDRQTRGDRPMLILYSLLIIFLSLLTRIHIPLGQS